MQREYYRVGLPEVPPYMQDLPIDPRGYPVPWFTPKINGEWDFQVTDRRKVTEAMQKHTCWICGKKLFRNLAYVIGPMCSITRVSSEPASHVECAEFAAKACPFLSRPKMPRPTLHNPAYKHEDGYMGNVPGVGILRNPGVCLVWVTRKYKPFQTEGGMLIEIGDPIRFSAWRESREATHEEIIESMRTGMPSLTKLCKTREDVADLIEHIKRAWIDLKLPTDLQGVIT